MEWCDHINATPTCETVTSPGMLIGVGKQSSSTLQYMFFLKRERYVT